MRDHPPESLITRLIELRLCSAADVQRAKRRVRRMSRDLPAFDSVWIDALIRRGALTPFQGRWLEHSPPESLFAGECVLLDGLGAGTASQTFLARTSDRRRRVVLKRLTLAADQAAAVVARLEQLLERGRKILSPQLAMATGLVSTPDAIYLVGPYVPGLNLSELMVRRGRFPARVVMAIADQVLSALSVLHAAGLPHGDVRLIKLRLTQRGQIVLVENGLRPALTPELLVHAMQSPEEADVVAPERIGTNQPATAASDLYAVGCVLWQLLSGRPPHPQADPLTKLAAHQTRRIPDVRELAPDTPPKLAEVIYLLTAPNPQDRPHSADAARRRLGPRRTSGAGVLARFRRQFDVTVPHLATRSATKTPRWQAVSAAVVCLGLAVLMLADRGLRAELLNLARQTWSEHVSSTEKLNHVEPPVREKFAEIPAPDARGVITFTDAGPYRVRELTAVGPLTLQAADGVLPEIHIQEKSLHIAAPSVTIKNVTLAWKSDLAPSESAALVQLRSQQLQITGCQFIGPGDSALKLAPENTAASSLAAVAWQPLDRRDPQAGMLHVDDTVFTGEMRGLKCLSAPRQVTWRNVLKSHAGSAVDIVQAQSPRGVKFVLDHVTLRQSGPLLTCSGPLTERVSAAGIDIEVADSVFEVTPPFPLVELRGPKVREDWPQAFRLLGNGSVIRSNAVLLATVQLTEELPVPLESDELLFEGLFIDEFEFAGLLTDDPHTSVLVKTQAPRRQAASMPGIAADRFAND